jgi:hypothetical protein
MGVKGQIAWNKGLKGYRGGIVPFPRGHVPWNKGLTKATSDKEVSAANKMAEAHRKNRELNGDNSGVAGKHDRLRHRNGRPRVCDNCGTLDAKYYDWANLDHKYNYEDEKMWARLCRKCHSDYDFGKTKINGLTIIERGGAIKQCVKYLVKAKFGDDNLAKRPDIRAKISKALTGRHPSAETLVKLRLSHLGKNKGDNNNAKRPEVRAKIKATKLANKLAKLNNR